MVQMTNLKLRRYAGKALSYGDSFEATRRDARLLEVIGHAMPVPAVRVEPQAPAVLRESQKAPELEPVAVVAAHAVDDLPTAQDTQPETVPESLSPEQANEADATVVPKRKYRRRDMTAES